MAQISISGDTSGTVTLAAPSVSGTSILSLPAVTDTLVGKATTDTLTNKTLTSPILTTPTIDSASVPTVSGTAPLFMCRAWVNFNGTGTIAIRASGNVSSITDNGVGDYTVNFTTAMSDANYCVEASSYFVTASQSVNSPQNSLTTSTVRITHAENNAAADSTNMYITIYR
jgi:hypothetical protein